MKPPGPLPAAPPSVPGPLKGEGCRVEFEAAPGGLQGAMLFRVTGQYDGAMLVRVYRALAETMPGEAMNVIGDTRAAETFVDYASLEEASRIIVEHGFRVLNVVICDRDAGRSFVVRLANAVSRIHGLQVQSRVVPQMAEAIAVLSGMMHGVPEA